MRRAVVSGQWLVVRSAGLRVVVALVMVVGMALPAGAHIGNKDVFETVEAGPYKLFVTIRTPVVIPGVATIEVRSSGVAVTGLTVTPLLLTGEASKHPPTADAMKVSKDDAATFTGSLWLMSTGSWQVRFGIDGAGGHAVASVPVAAMSTAVLRMQRPMGMLLGVLGLILVLGIVGIVGAAVKEARLKPGVAPDAKRAKKAAVAAGLAAVFALVAVYWGNKWWNVEAADYAADMHRNSEMRPVIEGDRLKILLGDPDKEAPGGWLVVKNADMLPDHGHLMHLYAIREPEMDAVFHLHPEPVGKEGMQMTLPQMPTGDYKLYGDVVFLNGFPETETAVLHVPEGFKGGALGAEDAEALPPGLDKGDLGTAYKLPDGTTMVWDRPETLVAGMPYSLRFTLMDATGKPAGEMEPYLGMAGHAAFVKADGTTFAHTHPEGSAAMAAVMLADASTATVGGDAMAGMDMGAMNVGPVVEFPYGFPGAGRYRVFVQMKRAGVVETGVFDAEVK
jgi:hypothetical protein